MGGEIDGRMMDNEFAHTVECVASCLDVLEDDTQFVGFQCRITIGDVAMEHIEEVAIFNNDDAIAFRMSHCLDEMNARSDGL